MRVLVTFAVEAEFAPWRKLRCFRKATLGKSSIVPGVDGFRATVDENSVCVLLTGIGRDTCEGTLARYDLSWDERPDVTISSGLAGALRPELHPGTTFAPRRIRTLSNDADATPDASLFDRAAQSGALPVETLITSKHLVQTAEEKKRLAFFAEAVDMESAYVMSKCALAGIPCLTIRTVSDSADEDLPIDFDRCLTPQGAVKPMSLINTIVERPLRIPKLIRFGRQSNEAIHKMIGFLDEFVAALPGIAVAAK